MVTYIATECEVVIPRQRSPPEKSTQDPKYGDDCGSGEGNKEHDPKVRLFGLHLGNNCGIEVKDTEIRPGSAIDV